MRWKDYLAKINDESYIDFFHETTVKYATLGIELAKLDIIPDSSLRTHRTQEQKQIMNVMWRYAQWAGK